MLVQVIRKSSPSILCFITFSLLLGGVLLLSGTTRGQGSANPFLGGAVRDSCGAVVAGAQVNITQTNRGIFWWRESARDGTFIFPLLLVGPYQLEVKKDGFGIQLEEES